LRGAARTRVVARWADNNIPYGGAVQTLEFGNAGFTADFNLMIVSFAGPLPGLIKYIQFGDADISITEFATDSSTLFGHPNAAGAAGVGAARFSQTPPLGVHPPRLEPFSLSGGTRLTL